MGVRKVPAFAGRNSAATASCWEAASLPGSSSLGLKLAQAEQGQSVWMRLATYQVARAFALALGMCCP